MSDIVTKIYSFIIVLFFLFSSIFLYKEIHTLTQNDTPFLSKRMVEKSTARSTVENQTTKVATTKNSFIPTTPTIDKSVIAVTKTIKTPQFTTNTYTEIHNACVSPIHYTIGTFDLRFGITKSYFLKTIQNSTDLWGKAVNKELFVYDATPNKGDLVINLIYDARQAKTDTNKLTVAEINNTKEAATALQNEYEAEKVIFLQKKAAYEKNIESFTTKQNAYNDSVALWNQKGGAPEPDYSNLMAQKTALEEESTALAQQKQELDTLLIDINNKITKHNELVVFANQKVNDVNTNIDTKFKEGMYIPTTNTIDIYQFADEIKLQRVLTHELGHALGIGHTVDPESIMYATNSGLSTSLAKEDIQALKTICGIK